MVYRFDGQAFIWNRTPGPVRRRRNPSPTASKSQPPPPSYFPSCHPPSNRHSYPHRAQPAADAPAEDSSTWSLLLLPNDDNNINETGTPYYVFNSPSARLLLLPCCARNRATVFIPCLREDDFFFNRKIVLPTGNVYSPLPSDAGAYTTRVIKRP